MKSIIKIFNFGTFNFILISVNFQNLFTFRRENSFCTEGTVAAYTEKIRGSGSALSLRDPDPGKWCGSATLAGTYIHWHLGYSEGVRLLEGGATGGVEVGNHGHLHLVVPRLGEVVDEGCLGGQQNSFFLHVH